MLAQRKNRSIFLTSLAFAAALASCADQQDFSRLGTSTTSNFSGVTTTNPSGLPGTTQPPASNAAALVCTSAVLSAKSGQSLVMTWSNPQAVAVKFSLATSNVSLFNANLGALSNGTSNSVTYSAPSKVSQGFTANITASMVSDPSVTSICSVQIAADGSFGSPDQGQQGLVANVYPIPVNTKGTPDDSIFNGATPLQTVVLSNFDYPESSYQVTVGGVSRISWYEMVIQGQLLIPTTGTYEFDQLSDDGSRLYIDGKLTIDLSSHSTLSKVSCPVNLTAGAHTIKVDYVQDAGPRAGLQLSMAQAKSDGTFTGVKFAIIPPSQYLRPANASDDDIDGSKASSSLMLGSFGDE